MTNFEILSICYFDPPISCFPEKPFERTDFVYQSPDGNVFQRSSFPLVSQGKRNPEYEVLTLAKPQH